MAAFATNLQERPSRTTARLLRPAILALVAAQHAGWDHARTHRVEAMEGGGSILWINDRCFIVMYGMIPFPMCGIGKIPVRGDLFDRMREPKGQEPNANNIAP